MLKQGLDIRLGQSLSMTPQLQQAIRLLQLSSIDLQAEIQQALEENPLLQADDSFDETPSSSDAESHSNPDDADNTNQTNDASDANEISEPNSLTETIPGDMDIDADWGEVYDTRQSSNTQSTDSNYLENQGNTETSLQEHLLWQVEMSNLSAIDKQIALTIIQVTDEDGYLQESLETLYTLLADDLLIDQEDVAAVLTYVQQLDPVGCASRGIGECLQLQLKQLPASTARDHALLLVKKQLDLMERRDYKEIRKRLKITQKELEEAIKTLRTLHPKPGIAFSTQKTDYIVPDAYVRKLHGEWVVSLNPTITPALQVNQLYASMAGKSQNRADNHYIKTHLQEARWLIRSLESRNTTVLNVAKAIIERQSAFMQYGEQAMKPLILRDIAEKLEMHESTISRVTSNKYLHTPRGIYEFKYFFSSQLDTDTGTGCSSTAIRAMIKQLIDKENPEKPLSDSKLTQLLKEQGINVARRTIAKYREAMFIPSSHERKTLVTT